MGDSRTAVQHESHIRRRMNLRQPFDVELRRLFIEAVRRSDRYGQRIDSGLPDKTCSILGGREPPTLLLSQLGATPPRRCGRSGAPSLPSPG